MARLMLMKVRMTFPNLYQPRMTPDDRDGQVAPGGKYDAVFLVPSAGTREKLIRSAMAEAARAKWGDEWKAVAAALKQQDRTALHGGAAKPDYPEFKGMSYITASNKLRPLAIDGQKNPAAEDSGVLYSGCYVNAKIEFWAMDNKFGKRLNAMLLGVQFAGHGEQLAGAAVATADDFELVAGTEDLDDPFGGDEPSEESSSPTQYLPSASDQETMSEHDDDIPF